MSIVITVLHFIAAACLAIMAVWAEPTWLGVVSALGAVFWFIAGSCRVYLTAVDWRSPHTLPPSRD